LFHSHMSSFPLRSPLTFFLTFLPKDLVPGSFNAASLFFSAFPHCVCEPPAPSVLSSAGFFRRGCSHLSQFSMLRVAPLVIPASASWHTRLITSNLVHQGFRFLIASACMNDDECFASHREVGTLLCLFFSSLVPFSLL